MTDEISHHWNYFLSIERDLERLRNFVEISDANANVYSMELSKILQLSCSEIDSVARMLCKHIDPTKDYYDESNYRGNIAQYKPVICKRFSQISQAKVEVPGLRDPVYPWGDWANQTSPQWWTEYNLVKHYRHSSYEKANLRNAIYAVSALMILLMYFYRDVEAQTQANPSPMPILLHSPYTSYNMISSSDSELPGF